VQRNSPARIPWTNLHVPASVTATGHLFSYSPSHCHLVPLSAIASHSQVFANFSGEWESLRSGKGFGGGGAGDGRRWLWRGEGLECV
jgi:hypothetical protein